MKPTDPDLHAVAPRRRRLRAIAPAGIALALALVASACGASASATAGRVPTVHEYLSILTGGMVKRPGWPKYVPADVVIPAGARVVVTISSFDDGTAPMPSLQTRYDKVFGTTGGSETVNGRRVTAIPNEDLAHTFTVPTLGINVPIPATTPHGPDGITPVNVTFSFVAPKAGTYRFECMAPCGSGPTGMGGPMDTFGWMEGNITVT
ncbi:MAG: cupredoxin domain-containing protein [Acidimicrobiales bacterium]|jgi:hypothetical protein